MKVTSRETYKVVRAMLEMKKFTQYGISKKEGVTFSLVNKTVNWFVARGYVARRQGNYEVMTPAAIFNLFPLYRTMKPCASFDVSLKGENVLAMIKGKGTLCLTSALSHYDAYYRDPAIYAYSKDGKLIEELKNAKKGLTRVELFEEDLNGGDTIKKNGQLITGKTRTVIDLFCANRAYAAERMIKNEWI